MFFYPSMCLDFAQTQCLPYFATDGITIGVIRIIACACISRGDPDSSKSLIVTLLIRQYSTSKHPVERIWAGGSNKPAARCSHNFVVVHLSTGWDAARWVVIITGAWGPSGNRIVWAILFRWRRRRLDVTTQCFIPWRE
jgi:hypothetical protein